MMAAINPVLLMKQNLHNVMVRIEKSKIRKSLGQKREVDYTVGIFYVPK
jgi:hypothetical protein